MTLKYQYFHCIVICLFASVSKLKTFQLAEVDGVMTIQMGTEETYYKQEKYLKNQGYYWRTLFSSVPKLKTFQSGEVGEALQLTGSNAFQGLSDNWAKLTLFVHQDWGLFCFENASPLFLLLPFIWTTSLLWGLSQSFIWKLNLASKLDLLSQHFCLNLAEWQCQTYA